MTDNRWKRNREAGLCGKCGAEPAPGRSMCRACLDKQTQQYAQNREARLAYIREYRRVHGGTTPEYNRQLVERIRGEVLEHYGNVCACCGESHREFLTLDHVNDDGPAHRKSIGKGETFAGYKFWAYLRRMGYPGGIQVLCWNCNAAKGHFGECPHRREKATNAHF